MSDELDWNIQSGSHPGQDRRLPSEHEDVDVDDEDDDSEKTEPEDYILPLKVLHSGKTGELNLHPEQPYSDLVLEPTITDGVDLTPLEQMDGPRPYWRFATPDTKVSMYCQTLYFVDKRSNFTLATIRTSKRDFPILIPIMPQDFGSLTIEDLIKHTLQKEGLAMKKITSITGEADIKTETLVHSHFQLSSYSPTAFFVETYFDSDALEFLTSTSRDVPLPMQTLLLQAETLVEQVAHARFCPFRAIHLARSILHLVISMIEDAVDSSSDRWFWQIADLQSTLALVNERISTISSKNFLDPAFQKSLDSLFHTLCYDRLGAVAIRDSYPIFQQFSELDQAYLLSPQISSDTKYETIGRFSDDIVPLIGYSGIIASDERPLQPPSQGILPESYNKPDRRLSGPLDHPKPTQMFPALPLNPELPPTRDQYQVLNSPARISTFDGDEAIPPLTGLLKNSSSIAQVDSASSPGKLAENADPQSADGSTIPQLIQLLNDENPNSRAGAASALGKLAEHAELQSAVGAAIPQLIKLLKDRFHDVQAATASALENLAENAGLRSAFGDALPQLIDVLKCGDGNAQACAASLLAKLAEHAEFQSAVGAGILQIIELFDDGDFWIRSFAASALEKLTEHTQLRNAVGAAIPQLIKLLNDSVYPALRVAAVSALEKFVEHAELRNAVGDAVLQLVDLLHNGDSNARAGAASTLGKLAEIADLQGAVGAAIPQLIELLKDGDSNVRGSAASTLGIMAENADLQSEVGAATPRLIELLKDSVSDVRAAATSALENLEEYDDY